MQGQKGTMGSFSETFNFDHGSTSSNAAAMEQQLCWSSIRNPVENRFPDCLMQPNEANVAYVNSYGREQQNMSRWSLGEPSSSGSQDEVSRNECRTGNGWSSSMSACPSGGPRIEERRYEQNSLFVQSSNSNSIPPDLNLNAGLMGHGLDSCQATEHSNLNKSSGSSNERISPPNASGSFLLSSGSSGCSVEGNDDRPGSSYEGRRASCKRKALEGTAGQSSLSGSSTYLHCTEDTPWPPAPAYTTAGHLSISTPLEQMNPRLGLSIRGSAANGTPDPTAMSGGESSHRNFRMRINPSTQQESMSPALFQMGDTARNSVVSSSSHQLPRFPSVDHSLDLSSTPVVDNATLHNRSSAFQVPTLPPNVQPFRWNGSSAPRTSTSTNSNVSGDRDAVPREEHRSRGSRNTPDHPIFMPAPVLRSQVRNPSNRSSRNLSIPGIVRSSSRTVSSSGPNQPSVNPSAPPNSSSRYPRRLSELVRRSLLASLAPESGAQNSNHSPLPAGPSASPEMVPTAGVVNPRSASWLDRQGDAVVGIPSLRNLVAAGEGRSRLYVTAEMHNVLELIRRGEGLRIEDVMILDQSGILGLADTHDRHRDMRLDVDNMSYEELLALEERIGNVNTGLSEETVLKKLKQQKRSITSGTKPEADAEPCCVCQEEYNDGDDLGILECGHDFHTNCIKQWLMQKNLCPICKTTGLST